MICLWSTATTAMTAQTKHRHRGRPTLKRRRKMICNDHTNWIALGRRPQSVWRDAANEFVDPMRRRHRVDGLAAVEVAGQATL